MGKPRADKAVVGDVSIGIGIISMLGDLHTVQVSNAGAEEKLSTVCPECDAPTQFMKSQLVCQDNPAHTATIATAKRGKMDGDKLVVVDGDKLVVVDAQAVKEARTSVLPEKEINLQVHPREQVERNTIPMGNVYRFVPKGTSPLYPVLVETIEKHPEVALVAKINMRKADHFVTVDVERDDLMVRELVWPEDLKEVAPVETGNFTRADLDKQGKMLATLLEATTEDFDPAQYAKDSRARIGSVIDEAVAGTGATPKMVAKVQATSAMSNLEDAIAAALAAKKAS